MASPQEKLATSLKALKKLQEGGVAIRSRDLSRTHRERLLKNGYLQKVIKGWYIPSRPDEVRGDSTSWYASFWHFCAAYLEQRFREDWSLSPEQSLFLHTGNRSVPQQLLVRASKGRNKATTLAHGISIFDTRASRPDKGQEQSIDGLRVFSLPAALISSGQGLFTGNKNEARTALAMVHDASELLPLLLNGEHSVVAGRLAGAFRNIGRDRIADDIVKSMKAAGYDVREKDPFADRPSQILSHRPQSPYVVRMQLMWQDMRGPVMENFPISLGPVKDIDKYGSEVEDNYATDAYHSLSIEGYRVSPDLIERVRTGAWNPDVIEENRQQRDTLAARGYYLAFEAVKQSVRKVLEGQNAGDTADDDHGDWYRAMFAPSVQAGILRATDLAGYRNDQVYIRHSTHIPPSREAVRDLMPAFFELLRKEEDAAVRVVLGHYFFVTIHPYMDGNGRIGRFLMNVMMAAGGYSWTVIPVEQRDEYMEVLESIAVGGDIAPLTRFIGQQLAFPFS